ncbi:hypothetical protein LRS73_31845 [Methylobacterium currus]|uniref:hypothetical protein n=1 Tax=Methylobacterium currus TaxID=2051553 RepID=UPI001E4A6C36|nr:hypothetical protein [Methylobacterium currus]UHC19451.1 hypothetical protein LRS73_31845 [Methylobacterium currus]
MISLDALARALGGHIRNGQVVAPGPGHSAVDRSMSVRLSEDGTDIVVHSFAGDDPIACKDYARQRAGLMRWEPHSRDAADATQRPTARAGHPRTSSSSNHREAPAMDRSDNARSFPTAEPLNLDAARATRETAATIVLPAPAAAPEPPQAHPSLGRPSVTWVYRDAAGGVIHFARLTRCTPLAHL